MTQTRLTFPADHPRPGTPAWIIHETHNPTKTTRREAHLTTCPHCHALTLHGLDGDIAATGIHADPTLIPAGIADAIPTPPHSHRRLAWIQNTGTHYRLTTVTNGLTALPRVLEHACGYPAPGEPLLATTPAAQEDICPF